MKNYETFRDRMLDDEGDYSYSPVSSDDVGDFERKLYDTYSPGDNQELALNGPRLATGPGFDTDQYAADEASARAYATDMASGVGPAELPKVAGQHAPVDIGGPPRGSLDAFYKKMQQVPGEPTMAATTGQRPQVVQPRIAGPSFAPAHHDNSLIPYRPETRAAMVKDVLDASDADQAEINARKQKAVIEADVMEQQYKDAEDRRIDRLVAENERKQAIAETRAKVDAIAEDVASSKIDSKRLYRNASTGTRIGLIIGGALGGLGGGPNQFMAQINQNIQNDIDEQKANLSNKRASLEHARGILGELRQEFGDSRTAELANEKAAWVNVEANIKSQVARSESPIIQAQGQKLLAATGAKLTDIQKQMDLTSYVKPHMVGGAGGQKGFVVKLPDGRQVQAPNEQKFNDLTTKSAQVSNIQANIDKALAIRGSANAADLLNPYSEVSKQLESLQSETAQMVTVARGQGAMSKGDQEVADKAIGSMTGILGSNDTVLRSTRNRFGEQLSREADALGAEDVVTGYTYDPSGRLVRDVALTGKSYKPKPNMPKGKPIR